MEHLFKFLLLAPYFYFDNWIEKANRNSTQIIHTSLN